MHIHIHTHELAMLIYAAMVVSLNLLKWKDFVSKALSENESPSSFRLMGYIFGNAIVFGFLYSTLKNNKLDTDQLKDMLIAMGVLFGLIKSTQIWGNKSADQQKTDDQTK
jgi:hypothetical protein